ncbi:MAG: hypothetical protein M5U09_30475, partial [Gammaproteobacteria bacterium]|nr:hypothetical protein [Gammaproteobacteria bacterium]
MLREGLRASPPGRTRCRSKRGIDQAVAAVIQALRPGHAGQRQAAYRNVATIAGNDPEVGATLAEALDQVGPDGVVTVEQGKTSSTGIELVEGMQFDKGYLSPYMVTNEDAMEVVLERPVILLWEKKVSDANALLPLLQQVSEAQRSLLIIAEDVDGSGVGDAGGQQHARHPARRRGEGAGVRRPTQGDDAGYRGPDRRHVLHRGPRHGAGQGHAGTARQRREGDHHQGHHHH